MAKKEVVPLTKPQQALAAKWLPLAQKIAARHGQVLSVALEGLGKTARGAPSVLGVMLRVMGFDSIDRFKTIGPWLLSQFGVWEVCFSAGNSIPRTRTDSMRHLAPRERDQLAQKGMLKKIRWFLHVGHLLAVFGVTRGLIWRDLAIQQREQFLIDDLIQRA